MKIPKKLYVKKKSKPKNPKTFKGCYEEILDGKYRDWLSVKYYGHEPKDCTFHRQIDLSI